MIAALPDRAVLVVSGQDRVAFLQGLVSNDVTEVAPGRAVWAALLTPQGKWLADFFLFADGDRLLLDAEAAHAPFVAQRLGRYRLRADITIAPAPLFVHAAWDEAPPATGIAAPDPRHAAAGWRVLTGQPLDPARDAGGAAYDRHRLSLGLPDGSRDLESEKTVLLEAGFDVFNGVSFTKGCFMGQELTARTRYRDLVKRRLMRVTGQSPLPPRGTQITAGGEPAGEMRSSNGTIGLALVRIDRSGGDLLAGDLLVTIHDEKEEGR